MTTGWTIPLPAFLMRAFRGGAGPGVALPAASILAAAPGLAWSPWGGRRASRWRATTSSMPTTQSADKAIRLYHQHRGDRAHRPPPRRAGHALGCLKPGGVLVLQTQRVLGTSASRPGAIATIPPISSSSPRPHSVPWRSAGRQRSSFMRMWRCSPNPEPGVFIWP